MPTSRNAGYWIPSRGNRAVTGAAIRWEAPPKVSSTACSSTSMTPKVATMVITGLASIRRSTQRSTPSPRSPTARGAATRASQNCPVASTTYQATTAPTM